MSSHPKERLKVIDGRARTARELPAGSGNVRSGRNKAQPAYRA